jgi:hypothetical protein
MNKILLLVIVLVVVIVAVGSLLMGISPEAVEEFREQYPQKTNWGNSQSFISIPAHAVLAPLASGGIRRT